MGLKLRWRNGIAYARGTVAGRRIRQSLGTRDPQQAEEARAALEARLWRSRVYGAEAVVTFEEAALSYLEDGGEGRFMAPLLHHFKGRALREIRPKDIRDAARRLYPGAAPATLNRHAIAPARAVVNHAAEQGWCQPIRVRQFAVEKPKRVAVDAAWIAAFRAAAKARRLPYLAALARFLFETGCRISEATGLKPSDLDLGNRTADIGRTKNGEAHLVDLSLGMMVELANLKPRAGRVFGYASRHSVYGPWETTCRAAGILHVPPHQAGRHSFATALDADGWSAARIAEAGRWKSVRMVAETYTHPERAGRLAADRLGSLLAQSEDGEIVRPLTKKGNS